MATLRRVEIEGYRSIKAVYLDLRALNVLIGSNGAGKSNFVSFFKLLSEMAQGHLERYVGTSGRAQSVLHFGPKVTPHLEARLQFENSSGLVGYSVRLVHAAGDTLVPGSEMLIVERPGAAKPEFIPFPGVSNVNEVLYGEIVREGIPTAGEIRRLLTGCRVFHFHDTSTTARVRLFSYLYNNHRLEPDAANLAPLLYAYRKTARVVYDRIKSAVRKIVPEFDDFDLEPSRLNPNEILLNWRKRGHDYLFGPHQLSDGSLRAMAICTLLLQPEADLPDLIVLDEPELGLHPHALELVAGLIRAASVRTQMIVATQSQSLLNFFEPSEIVTVETRDGQSDFRRLDADDLKDWLEDYTIGELWQRNVLGGGPLP